MLVQEKQTEMGGSVYNHRYCEETEITGGLDPCFPPPVSPQAAGLPSAVSSFPRACREQIGDPGPAGSREGRPNTGAATPQPSQ